MNEEFLRTLSSVVSNATPLVIASIGDTITERAGVINLSLDGSIILSAMFGFAAAYASNEAMLAAGVINEATVPGLSLILGFGVAMLVGGLVALLIAFSSIKLRQDQVAIGFVLTILCADLARFLGQEYTRIPGPQVPRFDIPALSEFPILGPVFFRQDIIVYFSFVLVIGVWFWLFRTRAGLTHRALGERPETAFARGARVNRMRYVYTFVGGMLVGMAGAAYSLNIKPGLANPPTMLGDGWIALAIVIFGGWHPFRVVLGAYLFSALRAVSADIQTNGFSLFGTPIEFNFVLLNALPWTLMIVTLLLVSSGSIDRLLRIMPPVLQKRLRSFLRSDPPKALGTRFDGDGA